MAPSSSDLFSRPGHTGGRKVLIIGTTKLLSEAELIQLRSLHSEHVSPASLMRQEISRTASQAKILERTLTAFRRWFWTRKPDAGFLLEGFPATLLQAMVLDEWLETRSEALDAIIVLPDADPALISYYSDLGLPIGGPHDFAP